MDIRLARPLAVESEPGPRFWAYLSGSAGLAGAITTEMSMTPKSKIKASVKISKRDVLLKLLHSNNGATLTQMQKATGWQPHSVRGFLSGTVKKKLGLKLRSEESKNSARRYSIAKA